MRKRFAKEIEADVQERLISRLWRAAAQENYETWRVHTPTFPSTGGGGIIIGEYNPVVTGDKASILVEEQAAVAAAQTERLARVERYARRYTRRR